ncbi:DUF2920 family protein [Campylobacter lari]|uniref:DUF2920 family protein n=1 Tax=Campylobacter lari TaxID=201 RepID=UPI0021E6A4AC|nr:DUF2920 family protein [Campylobacter lari]
MLKNETYFIDSCDDVELGIKRKNKLEYRISYDDEKTMKAIVFIIGGYGANIDLSIMDFNREFVAKKFDVVAVNVLYHCFSCRINEKDKKYSANFLFDSETVIKLKNTLNMFKINIDGMNAFNAGEYFKILDANITSLKQKDCLNKDYKIFLSLDLCPPNDEYQNYGIMAAIDHVNVLKDIIKKYPKFKTLPKIYSGKSYGGYLSLLIAKIAPWYIDGVIDNSGEAMLLLGYIIGKDLNNVDAFYHGQNYTIGAYLKTLWNADRNSPYCFKDENFLIRTLFNKDHLLIQANKSKNIIYTSYHSSADEMTSYEYKTQFMEFLKALGYEVNFHLIKEEDIDGKFVKNLDHGCGITDKAMFNKELPLMLEKLKDKTFDIKEDSISYPCKDKVFTFKDKGDKFVLEII